MNLDDLEFFIFGEYKQKIPSNNEYFLNLVKTGILNVNEFGLVKDNITRSYAGFFNNDKKQIIHYSKEFKKQFTIDIDKLVFMVHNNDMCEIDWNKYKIIHINNDNTDNFVVNLRMVQCEQNNEFVINMNSTIEQIINTCNNIDAPIIIEEYFVNNLSKFQIKEKYNYSYIDIYECIIKYSHFKKPDEIIKKQEIKKTKHQLKNNVVNKIKTMHNFRNYSIDRLCELFNLTKSTVERIILPKPKPTKESKKIRDSINRERKRIGLVEDLKMLMKN